MPMFGTARKRPARACIMNGLRTGCFPRRNAVASLKLVNNIVQADYDSLKFGPTMDRPQEVFVLAGETQTLTIQVNFLASFIRGQSIFENFETTPVLLQMYGNALLTRGLPTPFEIATQIKSGTDTGNQK